MAYALQFDGTNPIIIPDAADLDLQASVGWTVWFKAKVADNSGASMDTLLDIEDGTFTADYALAAIANASHATAYLRNAFYGSVKDHATVTKNMYSPAATFPNADFVTYYVSHDNGNIYVGWCANGGSVQEGTETSSVGDILGKKWYIGSKTDGTNPVRSGTQIESFGVSSGKMTNAEIEAVAAGTAFDATTATVVRYYQMNEGSGGVINDKANTGNAAYQGAFTGLTWVDLGGGSDTTVNATLATISVSAYTATVVTSSPTIVNATIGAIGVSAFDATIVTEASITTDVLKNNTGTVLASTSGIIASVYDLSTGALVVRKTGLTSDGSGVVTFSDVSLSNGTEYLVTITIATADGVARITAG